MSITVEQARSLAVRYQAFVDCLQKGDNEGLSFWGGLLLEAQQITGVEFYPERWLIRLIERADLRAELAA